MYKNIEEELIDLARNPAILTKDMDNVGQITEAVETILANIDTTLTDTHTLSPFTQLTCLLKEKEELFKKLAHLGNETIKCLRDCRNNIEKAYEDGSIFNHGVVFGVFSAKDIEEKPQESSALSNARKLCDDLDNELLSPVKPTKPVEQKSDTLTITEKDLTMIKQKIHNIMDSANQEKD